MSPRWLPREGATEQPSPAPWSVTATRRRSSLRATLAYTRGRSAVRLSTTVEVWNRVVRDATSARAHGKSHAGRDRAVEEAPITDRAVGGATAHAGHSEETFAGTIDEALRLGWTAHLYASRSVLIELEVACAASAGERALCRALQALIAVALGDRRLARRLARNAISASARPPAATPRGELRVLRLARALAVKASALLGDRVRAQRAVQVQFIADDPESAWITRAGVEVSWSDAPPSVRRYARFVAAVQERYVRQHSMLTDAEIAALRQTIGSATADCAAASLDLSPHTVRTHLRSAYRKLMG